MTAKQKTILTIHCPHCEVAYFENEKERIKKEFLGETSPRENEKIEEMMVSPYTSRLIICSKCGNTFRVKRPAGLKSAKRLFELLRKNRGEVRSKDLGLSREEQKRAMNYFGEERVIERTSEGFYRLVPRYRYFRDPSKGANQTVIIKRANEQAKRLVENTPKREIPLPENPSMEVLEEVSLVEPNMPENEQGELLKMYPLVNVDLRPMPMLVIRQWTDSKGVFHQDRALSGGGIYPSLRSHFPTKELSEKPKEQ